VGEGSFLYLFFSFFCLFSFSFLIQLSKEPMTTGWMAWLKFCEAVIKNGGVELDEMLSLKEANLKNGGAMCRQSKLFWGWEESNEMDSCRVTV